MDIYERYKVDTLYKKDSLGKVFMIYWSDGHTEPLTYTPKGIKKLTIQSLAERIPIILTHPGDIIHIKQWIIENAGD